MKITLLILSPDFQIYVTQGHGAQLYHADVYKLQWICSGAQPGFFIAVEILGKRAQYMQYYSYIISAIYNTLISVTKTNHSMTLWLKYWYVFLDNISETFSFVSGPCTLNAF